MSFVQRQEEVTLNSRKLPLINLPVFTLDEVLIIPFGNRIQDDILSLISPFFSQGGLGLRLEPSGHFHVKVIHI